jgi:hypothetical protein
MKKSRQQNKDNSMAVRKKITFPVIKGKKRLRATISGAKRDK